MYYAWQTGDEEWLARLLESFAKEIRDGAKMGSANKDRKQLLQVRKHKIENYRKMMFRLDLAA
jgi:hypothetical protein